MPAVAPMVLFEPHGDPVRISPCAPLGPWAQAPLERLLGAADPSRPVLLDLRRAPLFLPREVATVLWVDDQATAAGLDLEILAADMPSAELLDFAGVRAPVYSRPGAPSGWPARAAAPAARRRARSRARARRA